MRGLKKNKTYNYSEKGLFPGNERQEVNTMSESEVRILLTEEDLEQINGGLPVFKEVPLLNRSGVMVTTQIILKDSKNEPGNNGNILNGTGHPSKKQ